MKYLTFTADGSSASGNIELVIKYMKNQFKEITYRTSFTGRYLQRCDINCHNHEATDCLKYLKGFASHAMYMQGPNVDF